MIILIGYFTGEATFMCVRFIYVDNWYHTWEMKFFVLILVKLFNK